MILPSTADLNVGLLDILDAKTARPITGTLFFLILQVGGLTLIRILRTPSTRGVAKITPIPVLHALLASHHHTDLKLQ